MNKQYNYEDPFNGKEPTRKEYEEYIDHLKEVNQRRVELIKSCSDYYLVQHLDFSEDYLSYEEFIEYEKEIEKEKTQKEATKMKMDNVHKELLMATSN